jgi:hypothetical protein
VELEAEPGVEAGALDVLSLELADGLVSPFVALLLESAAESDEESEPELGLA